MNCNDPITDQAIVVENINAIYQRETNALGDTLFSHRGEVLVFSDEVHHAYTHLTFSGPAMGYDFDSGREGAGETRDERLWMRYLREEPGIRRHIGFTGTPYNKDDYFPDVLFNYSIKDARDEKIIKRINPILKTETDEGDADLTQTQRFEQIIATHRENREMYAYPDATGRIRVKPITIFIHPKQKKALENADQFIRVLAQSLRENEPECRNLPTAALEQQAGERVITVVSRLAESEYRQKLEQIEETDPQKPGGRVEFIFAVNKLSEGWDVDNVFQIVPSEERVFNSKLLISQVLGRGLRLPRNVPMAEILHRYPVVTVTNHERFARHVRELLEEVTECELRLASNPIQDPKLRRYARHFHVFTLEYLPDVKLKEKSSEELQNGTVPGDLVLTPSSEKLGLKVIYLEGSRRFELTKEFFTIDQVVLDVERRFRNTLFEIQKYDFGENPDPDLPRWEEIENVIRSAMERAGISGDRLSLENKRQIELYFNQYLPKGRKKVIRENIGGSLKGIRTQDMPQKSARSDGLSQEISVFVSEDFQEELTPENRFVLDEILQQPMQMQLPLDESLQNDIFGSAHIRPLAPGKHIFAVNPSLFRTPQDTVIVSHEPERLFVFRLIASGRLISAWVKSPDTEFYSIDYEYWKGGKDRVRRSFNPDFFIRIHLEDYLNSIRSTAESDVIKRWQAIQDQGIEDLMVVAEIKDDDDQSDVTRSKARFAALHFESVNRRLAETNPVDYPEKIRGMGLQRYVFFLLRPLDYPGWFSRLENGKLVFDL